MPTCRLRRSATLTLTELPLSTGTSQDTWNVFGSHIPISSLKSYMGHTLGACGALEAWFTIEMMREGWFAPTINLTGIDPECAELDYIVSEGRELQCEYVMSNNFAF